MSHLIAVTARMKNLHSKDEAHPPTEVSKEQTVFQKGHESPPTLPSRHLNSEKVKQLKTPETGQTSFFNNLFKKFQIVSNK